MDVMDRFGDVWGWGIGWEMLGGWGRCLGDRLGDAWGLGDRLGDVWGWGIDWET